ncbi:acyl-CoA thioesterase [Qipengyuania marisflavi]|uniref:acyl-CoA thioesterase n=1 Tax=Qipengyuania marisflavi TaxID=2486356 RepID=UPI00148603E8|nr:thioesterase family protein [Qipengyuania marisflavi]
MRFADCDPAGIAYYPALFALCDAAIEEWTGVVIGVSRQVMHQDMALALPTVTMQADFAKVVAWGDQLDIAITTRRVGSSSVDLIAAALCNGEQRFTVSYTQVLMRMAGQVSQPWPQDWRERLEHSVQENAQ